MIRTTPLLPPPSMADLEQAVKIALAMREAQRRFFGSIKGTNRSIEALKQSRDLEREFDLLTKDWQPDEHA